MTDGVIKGTGNSRFIKGPPNSATLWPTYDDFIAAWAAGEVTIDLAGINPSGWTTQGTKLNKANLLADSVAAKFGLSASSGTPSDAFLRGLVIANAGLERIEEYKTPGSYTWKAPDLYNGRSYYIIVCVLGGGGSGAAFSYSYNGSNNVLTSQNYACVSGGASGCVQLIKKLVTPNTNYAAVVGTGGAESTATCPAITSMIDYAQGKAAGNSGGSSSFSSIVANGGQGGSVGQKLSQNSGGEKSHVANGARGGQCSDTMTLFETVSTAPFLRIAAEKTKHFSSALPQVTASMPIPRAPYFDFEPLLFAGGGAYNNDTSRFKQISDVYGGGDAVINVLDSSGNQSLSAPSATFPGAGGGAALLIVTHNGGSQTATATSGRGGNGMVQIYTLGRPLT